jgi:hypothetical protein
MANPLQNYTFKGPGFFSSFGTFPILPESDLQAINDYNHCVVLNMQLNNRSHYSGQASTVGSERCRMFQAHLAACDGKGKKCWLLSQCIRGLAEKLKIGCCCLIPDLCATMIREAADDPTGGTLVHVETQIPLRHQDPVMIRA